MCTMPVYVDDMRAQFGRMVMCHMIADTSTERLRMADRVGVARRWIQHPNTPDEHFDISLSKRALALQHGAIEITWRQCGAMTARKREQGILGPPEEAEAWLRADCSQRLASRILNYSLFRISNSNS